MSVLRDIRSFSGLLADLREDQGWSQNQLAFDAGLNPSFVCLLEAGKRKPSRDTIAALAETLGLDAGDTSRLFVAAGLLPPGRWVVLDDDADLLIRAAREVSA